MPSYEEKGGYKNPSLCSLHCQNAILSACVIIDEERNFEQRQMTVGYGYQSLETPVGENSALAQPQSERSPTAIRCILHAHFALPNLPSSSAYRKTPIK
jgi:hypothetical protein